MVTMEGGKNRTLWQVQLTAGLRALSIDVRDDQIRQLLDYLALLVKWNKTYNLTAINLPEQMVSRQLMDSLSILALIEGPRVLDVGTGAGLPGIPLAIMRPDLNFVLLDSNSKKTRFVNQVRLELGLENIEVVHARVETYEDDSLFQTITSRAFATLDDMLRGSAHLLAENGQWLAMKGQEPINELELVKGYKTRVIPLNVPDESGLRHAVSIRR